MRRLEMLKAREMLRLKFEAGLSVRDIGNACNCGKSTVSDLLNRAQKAGITWPIELSDKQLMSALYPRPESRTSLPEPDMEYTFHEMKKKNVTLMLLWEEYKDKHPDGIMYTQFCDRYRKFKKHNNLSMHKEHKAGEEIEVDWAGSTMSYIDPGTGVSREALEKNVCSYKYFSIMLKKVAKNPEKAEKEKIIQHENVRGSSAYQGGGIRA